MDHEHNIVDHDTHFKIDPISRKIEPTVPDKVELIQRDHNSERFTFELPRYIEGHDMSLCTNVQVHYNNIRKDRKAESRDVYESTDLTVIPANEDEEEKIQFSWLISKNATQYIGKLSFIIRMACIDEENEIVYDWHSAVYSAIRIGEGINNEEIPEEKYADILEAWRTEVLKDIEVVKHSCTSLERLGDYIYKISFAELPEEHANDAWNPRVGGGCSSYVQNGKLYRNLDWDYDDLSSFLVTAPGFKGMAFIPGLTNTELSDGLLSQLPYRMLDGINESGIMVSTHVLFNDWEWIGSGSMPLYKLPFIILSNLKSMGDINTVLGPILPELYATPSLLASEYLLQFMVTDGITTYVITPPTSKNGQYSLVNATGNPKLTNFRWVSSPTVARAELQNRPTGVERWNMMPCSLKDLRFTKAYEEPTRLSEFIGVRETTKDSTDAELEVIYELAKNLYEDRVRDGRTWQTMHSIVYSAKGIEMLCVQENWDRNYVGSSSSGSYDDTELRNKISTIEGKESGWDAKYDKPDEGIPASDMAEDVRESLEKADSALQEHQSLEGYASEEYVDNEINDLQEQIDAVISRSDVIDVVGTYAELQAYDTSEIGDKDVIKVLQDSAHENGRSYYRWSATTSSWNYVGSEGAGYTKAEADTLLNDKVDKVSGKGLSTNDYTDSDKEKVDSAVQPSDLDDYAKTEDIPTDEHINSLINAKLGVIENGSY